MMRIVVLFTLRMLRPLICRRRHSTSGPLLRWWSWTQLSHFQLVLSTWRRRTSTFSSRTAKLCSFPARTQLTLPIKLKRAVSTLSTTRASPQPTCRRMPRLMRPFIPTMAIPRPSVSATRFSILFLSGLIRSTALTLPTTDFLRRL